MRVIASSSLGPLGRELARPSWVREHPRAPWAAVLAVCLGAFMGQLDASIVTLAFPRLQVDFHASLSEVQWVSLAYLGVLAVLLVPVGRWSDVRGRKLLYVNGFVLFTVASAACGLAPRLGWLVAARALQAVGAALLQANSVALVVRSVGAQRARAALEVQAAAQAMGLAAGPAVGGVLVDAFGWRSVFWLNVPVGAVAVAAGLMLLPRTRDLAPRTNGDPAGGVLLGVTVLAALATLTQLAAPLTRWPLVATSAALAVVGGLSLWRVEGRVRVPLISPSRLRSSGIAAGLTGALLGYLVLFAPLVLYPQVFRDWQMSTARGGLVLTCLPAGFVLSALVGTCLGRTGSNTTRVRVGAATAACSALLQCVTWSSPLTVALLLVATGAGLGVALPANNAIVMASVPPSDSGVTGGMINVARALGTSLGVALTAMGVRMAETNGWARPPLTLLGLAVAAVLLAVTGGGRPAGLLRDEGSTP